MAYIDNVTNILQIQPDGLPTFVRLSQNENGRNLYFQLAGNEIDIPANATITISGTKPDGTVYSGTGSISDNVILIPEMIQMTAVAGYWDAKVKIISGGNTIATGRIRFVIDADTVDPDSVPSDSELEGLVAEAQQYAETARTEAYGSPLTATTAAGMTDHTRVYVYTGSETGYTAGHWYYWDGTQWTDGGIYNSTAVNTDPTLTLAGVAADAKATGDAIEAARVAIDDTLTNEGEAADAAAVGSEISGLKEDFNNNIDYNLPVIDGWIQNVCIDSGVEVSSNYYDATDYISIIPALSKLTIVAGDTSWFSRAYNAWYDKNKNYISSFTYSKNASIALAPPANAAYFRISRGKEAGNTASLSISTDYDDKTVCDWIVEFYQSKEVLQTDVNGLKSVYNAENRIENRLVFDANGTYNPNVKMSINVGYGVISISDNNYGSSVHLELKNPVSTIPNPASATKFITLRANHEYKLRTIPVSGSFTGLDNNIYCAISSGGQSADLIVAASGAEKTISYSSDTNVSLYLYVKYETTATVVFQYVLEDVTPNDNGDYIIGSDLRKRTVNVSPRLGILSGAQAFCMYDGKYYSFNNTDSKIYVQDASFANVSNHDVSIGHGNALQLGSSHYAYASGWDDNTVYKVDLDDCTVVDTIALPTTGGTTTCVVDDVNEIVYIFHRTTSAYTEGSYTFIAYDYANQTELCRRSTPPCAALQGCDFVNGTIITTSGLGTAGYPDLTNYYRLYNTSGDVIGEYKFPSFASREPEGVFVDRTTLDVYFDIERSVYKVSSLDG